MNQEINSLKKIFGLFFTFLVLFAFFLKDVAPAKAEQNKLNSNTLHLQVPTDTPTASPTNTSTPTSTPTPVTGLNYSGSSYGCTAGPYITCSASVTSAHTDPYRWDFDITYNYNDNRTNFGSTFSLTLNFTTGLFNTNVPIWWNMYPITN